MTKFDRFRLAICELGVEEACLVFGYKRGDPFIKEMGDEMDIFIKEKNRCRITHSKGGGVK